jgi:hypothetical protein
MKSIKHKIYSVPLLFIFIFSLIVFHACKDDPVTPANNEPALIDSSFFDWQYIHIPAQDIFNIYAADSDNVFVLGNPEIYHVNDTNVSVIGSYNMMRYIEGTSVNNFFIGGGYLINSISYSRIVRWNGSNFSEIQTPLDSSGPVIAIYPENENETWFSTSSNKVYNYLNGNLTTTYLPDKINFSKFYKKDTKLYLIGLTIRNPIDLFYAFVFENNEWRTITQDTMFENSDITDWTNVVGDDFLRYGKKTVYSFSGNSWQNICTTPDFEIFQAGGYSKENFLSAGLLNNNVIPKVVYRINYKWYLQDNFLPPYPVAMAPIAKLVLKDTRYFGFFVYRYNNYLFKGSYRKVVTNGQ